MYINIVLHFTELIWNTVLRKLPVTKRLSVVIDALFDLTATCELFLSCWHKQVNLPQFTAIYYILLAFNKYLSLILSFPS